MANRTLEAVLLFPLLALRSFCTPPYATRCSSRTSAGLLHFLFQLSLRLDRLQIHEMASSNATVEVASFDVPISEANPFAWVQAQLVAQMYPPFAAGFRARTTVLLVILTA